MFYRHVVRVIRLAATMTIVVPKCATQETAALYVIELVFERHSKQLFANRDIH